MRRFIFICVAMIALFATNASGTKNQVTDQLQTHYTVVDHQFQPAITPVHFETTAVVQVPEAIPVNYISSNLDVAHKAYHNPDYGLCSHFNYTFAANTYIQNTTGLYVQRE